MQNWNMHVLNGGVVQSQEACTRNALTQKKKTNNLINQRSHVMLANPERHLLLSIAVLDTDTMKWGLNHIFFFFFFFLLGLQI